MKSHRVMKSHRLKYRFASMRYAKQRWPDGFAYLPHQLSPHMAQISLLDCCQMAGLSSARSLRHRSAIPFKAVAHLAKSKSQRLSGNAYHSCQHIAQVIIAAGLLAEAASLTQAERDLVILAALVHDYGHLGRRRDPKAFWQERRSANMALPCLQRYGADGRLYRSLYAMILATSPAADKHKRIQPSMAGLPLLLDADLFASLFSSKKQVDALTGLLKYEDRITTDRSALRDKFMAHCAQQGFASSVSALLHQALRPNHTYFAG